MFSYEIMSDVEVFLCECSKTLQYQSLQSLLWFYFLPSYVGPRICEVEMLKSYEQGSKRHEICLGKLWDTLKSEIFFIQNISNVQFISWLFDSL